MINLADNEARAKVLLLVEKIDKCIDNSGTDWSGRINILVNRSMLTKRSDFDRASCMGVGMTEVQREVFLYIDEYWKQYGYGPSIRDICEYRKKPGLSNTVKIVDRLVKLGVLKRVRGMGRSVRPVYINFRTLE